MFMKQERNADGHGAAGDDQEADTGNNGGHQHAQCRHGKKRQRGDFHAAAEIAVGHCAKERGDDVVESWRGWAGAG